jgi:carbonic anhydrase
MTEGAGGPVGAQLDELHLHWPSEHSVNGSFFALELHLVHADEADAAHKEVAAILFPLAASGAHNALLDSFLLDAGAPLRVGRVALQALLEDTLDAYWSYEGSLTSPPCSPGVSWRVLVSRTGVSQLQVNAYTFAVGGLTNSRPLQPLNGRSVEVRSWR